MLWSHWPMDGMGRLKIFFYYYGLLILSNTSKNMTYKIENCNDSILWLLTIHQIKYVCKWTMILVYLFFSFSKWYSLMFYKLWPIVLIRKIKKTNKLNKNIIMQQVGQLILPIRLIGSNSIDLLPLLLWVETTTQPIPNPIVHIHLDPYVLEWN